MPIKLANANATNFILLNFYNFSYIFDGFEELKNVESLMEILGGEVGQETMLGNCKKKLIIVFF